MNGTVNHPVSPFDLMQQHVRLLDEKRRVDYATEVGEMKVGSWGWATDWTMDVRPDGTMWLRSTYTVHPKPGGTVQLLVRRASRTTWHVDARYADSRWQPEYSCSDLAECKVSRLISMTPADEWGRRSLMVSSVLPLYLSQMTVETLLPGQGGWTVSWVNSDAFAVHKQPSGTVKLLVRRRRNGELVYELKEARDRRLAERKARRNTSKPRRGAKKRRARSAVSVRTEP